jgi:hypothetical protein
MTIMPIFATPDFGAGALANCFVFTVGAILFTFAYAGFMWGVRIFRHGSPRAKKWGVCLLVVCGLVPILFLVGPNIVTRLTCGNFLLDGYPYNNADRIKKGMPKDEVVAILGTPHQRGPCFYNDGEGERWMYYLAPFGISYFAVEFGQDGGVMSTFRD